MKKEKNLILIALLLLVTFTSYTFMTFSKKEKTNKSIENVIVENLEVVENNNGKKGNSRYEDNTIILKPILNNIEDAVIYRITLKNNSNKKVTLQKITYEEDNLDSNIVFDYSSPKETLDINEETTFTITSYIDENNIENNNIIDNYLTINYEYVEK